MKITRSVGHRRTRKFAAWERVDKAYQELKKEPSFQAYLQLAIWLIDLILRILVPLVLAVLRDWLGM